MGDKPLQSRVFFRAYTALLQVWLTFFIVTTYCKIFYMNSFLLYVSFFLSPPIDSGDGAARIRVILVKVEPQRDAAPAPNQIVNMYIF
jgi:hypothetical protein